MARWNWQSFYTGCFSTKIPVAWAIKPTVYAQFCGGETIEESENTIDLLSKNGVRTILDFSAEGVTSEEELDRNCSEILAAIKAASDDSRHAFSVFKPSGLSLQGLLSKSAYKFTVKGRKNGNEF